MKTLLIVFHSMTDGTRQMAQAACNGANEADTGLQILLMHAAEVAPAQVLAADGYVFATPENLASMSGMMKDFFDRCYYPVLDQLNGRPYAVLVCAGSDGHGAVRQIDRIATGWRLKRAVEEVIVCTHAQTPERILAVKHIESSDLARCAELGASMAVGLDLGVF